MANQTDNTLITNCQVQVGYFSLINQVMQSTAITPTTTDVPAVSVTVNRTDGQNGGAVVPFIAQVLGINFMNATAQSISMLSCPSQAPPGGALPVAINQQILPYLWNTTDPNNSNLSQPFNIGSDYHYPDLSNDAQSGQQVVAGEWTSFDQVANDSSTIKNLVI